MTGGGRFMYHGGGTGTNLGADCCTINSGMRGDGSTLNWAALISSRYQ